MRQRERERESEREREGGGWISIFAESADIDIL